MRNTEELILNIFRDNSSKDINAEFLAKELYPKEYSEIEALMNSTDRSSMHQGKRQKFQMHRKILYYLNKLVDDNIIKVNKIADKGEKYFALVASDGDTIIEKGYKKIIISKPTLNTTYIDQYESNGVMRKYEGDSWITRLNSILLECSINKDTTRLYKIMNECMGAVNDAIALNEFETVINTATQEELKDFFDKISKDSDDFNKTISIIIDMSLVNNKIYWFIKYFAEQKLKRINIVFNITNKDLQKYTKIFETIIEEFSKQKIKINIKNNDLAEAPYFKGRSGIYNFEEHDWEIYQKKYKGNTIGLSCSQSQIAISINRFFEIYKTDTEFRQAVLNAAKTLLMANTIQRRRSNEYFRNINQLNSPHQSDFFRFSKNYIRFWNYDWHKDIDENNNLFELIKSTKEVVDNFCLSEETVYKSCGIPIRFNIAFSSAFRNFDSKFMGERDYKKANVKGAEDYYNGETKSFIAARERMFKIFDGGDRLRIFRAGDFETEDIIHEISILLNAYKTPFFTYDFSGLRGMVKLTNFI